MGKHRKLQLPLKDSGLGNAGFVHWSIWQPFRPKRPLYKLTLCKLFSHLAFSAKLVLLSAAQRNFQLYLSSLLYWDGNVFPPPQIRQHYPATAILSLQHGGGSAQAGSTWENWELLLWEMSAVAWSRPELRCSEVNSVRIWLSAHRILPQPDYNLIIPSRIQLQGDKMMKLKHSPTKFCPRLTMVCFSFLDLKQNSVPTLLVNELQVSRNLSGPVSVPT